MKSPEQRIRHILEHAAVEQRPCKFCGTLLYFVPSRKTQKNIPFTVEGVNHFEDCPQYQAKPKPAEVQQQTMFPEAAPRVEAWDPRRG